jgi:Transposase DDE domain group 1
MSMRGFEIVQSDTDTVTSHTVTSHSGLALVGRALAASGIDTALAAIPQRHGIAHADCVKSYVGLLATGRSDFDAIENCRSDAFFASALGIDKVPSAPSLRQRFDEHANAMIPHIDATTVRFLAAVRAPVTPITVRQGTSIRAEKRKYVPLDIDVFPMDNSKTKKEGVSYTYKGFDGYAPIAAYLGEEGWCIGCELRPGSQHGQSEFTQVLERVVPRAKQLTRLPLLCRLDSGHDAAATRAWLHDANVDLILKWNPRKQDLEAWRLRAVRDATWTFPREGKRVGTFSEAVSEDFGGKTRAFRRVVRVTVREIDKHGERLLVPDITLEGWWTSFGEGTVPDERVIALYCAHATSEQFHSEFKTDLDIERLPSGKFATNDLVLTCAMFAYNILRWIGQTGLTRRDAPIRHHAQRRRIRTVMQELMFLAARVTESGRRLALKFSAHCPAFASFTAVHARLCAT